jgi:predicted RNase H-like HicB family nuclease
MTRAIAYRVIVTREDDAWLADVQDLEGAHTWAMSLPALHENIREVITLAAQLPDDARVTYTVEGFAGESQSRS